MALISTLDIAGTTHPSRAAGPISPYFRFFILDYAKALVAKGSALAASDIVEVLDIPANSIVLGAGARVLVAGNSTTLTLGVGTGVDDNEWVDALDGKATAGTAGADLNPDTNWKTYSAADTVDVTFQTLTGTLTTGQVLVYVLMADVDKTGFKPGIAALKS